MTTTANATTIKLSDTQLVLLSQAAQHPERAVDIPERLRGGAVQRVVGPLLAKGLVEVVPHRGEMPVYKTEPDGSRLALVITNVGLLALGIEPDAPAGDEPPAEQPGHAKKRKAGRKPDATRADATEAEAPLSARTRQPRTGTKQEMLIAMLRRPEGATVPEVVEAMGWQPHTVRGAIAGALKKRLGLQISSEKVDGRGRVYRVG
jgi:Protein of unknown function (DUF3489)